MQSPQLPSAENEPASSAPRTVPLFLVLEGGGAKGIAHVAAWSALESTLLQARSGHQYAVEQVAGTSAGAIAGALIAAGATGDQMLDEDGSMPLADPLGIKYFYDLFGLSGWRRLKLWRAILSPSQWTSKVASRMTGAKYEHRLKLYQDWNTRRGSIFQRWISTPSYILVYFLSDLARPIIPAIATLTVLMLAGLFLDRFVLPHPHLAAIEFLLFAILSACCLLTNSRIVQRLEQSGRRNHRRHFSGPISFLLHPGTSIVASFITIGVLSYHTPLVEWTESTLAVPLAAYLPIIGQSWIYAFDILICIYAAMTFLRGFLKGVVNTELLQTDINKALQTILTQEIIARTLSDRRHVWNTKLAATAQQQVLFDRVSRPNYRVTFTDLHLATGRKLSVITADTIANAIQVYSTDTHPDHPVAHAVAASAAIPFAFRPARAWRRLLVDGGIVSSIPAWVFRQHRNRDPDARILAVAIGSAEQDLWIPAFLAARDERQRHRNPLQRALRKLATIWTEPMASIWWPIRFMANVVYTTMFGARQLELDASDRLDIFPLNATFGLFDFDKPRKQVVEERDRLRHDARLHIEELLWGRQLTFEQVANLIVTTLTARAIDWRQRRGHAVDEAAAGRIRIFIAEPEVRARAVRIKRTYNFLPSDHDDRLLLPFESSLAGYSAGTRPTPRSYFADRAVLDAMLTGPINRYRRRVKWSSSQWCWTIPVFRPDRPNQLAAILAIEGDRPFDIFGDDLNDEAQLRANEWRRDGSIIVDAETHLPGPPQDQIIARTQSLASFESAWSQLIGQKLYLPRRP